MTMFNVKGVTHSDKSTEIITNSAVPLCFQESLRVFKFIVFYCSNYSEVK